MALPSNVGYGTITGRLMDSAGEPISGSFRFTPSPTSLINVNTSPKVVILPKPVTVPLVNGAFSVDLIATDDKDNSPVNWTYRVDFTSTTPGTGLEPFNTDCPENSVRDLSILIPIASSNGVTIVRGVGVPNGGTPGQVLVKASDSDGDTVWGAGGGGGGGAVFSVAGKTGVVVLTRTDVGLSNVNNTTDASKPVSTAQQAALDAKADLVNGLVPLSQLPANSGGGGGAVSSVAGKTGAVTLVKADVGLSNVDNTTDVNKPISSATASALAAKASTSDLNNGLSTKANSSDVTSSLAAKANASDVSTIQGQITTLNSTVATKATVPSGTRLAVSFSSSVTTDPRPGGSSASHTVMWFTTYSTAPVNLLTDIDIWFPPAT